MSQKQTRCKGRNLSSNMRILLVVQSLQAFAKTDSLFWNDSHWNL